MRIFCNDLSISRAEKTNILMGVSVAFDELGKLYVLLYIQYVCLL